MYNLNESNLDDYLLATIIHSLIDTKTLYNSAMSPLTYTNGGDVYKLYIQRRIAMVGLTLTSPLSMNSRAR